MMLAGCAGWQADLASATVAPVTIQPQLAPDQSLYDAADPLLRAAGAALQDGLQAADVAAEEAAWTRIIEQYGGVDAPWAADVVGRALGNRGNARSRQGKLEEALADYNEAIRMCPWSPDPVLNRGVVLEALHRWEEAIVDYRSVLVVLPEDPSAWNNLGNASASLGRWSDAAEFFGKAVALAPEFSFAAGNHALATYELGKQNEAMREMRTLLRRYPDFPDMRAALAAALWAQGQEADAETQWGRLSDPRYKDLTWLSNNRRWPPSLASAWRSFIKIQSVPAAAAAARRVGA